MSCEDIPSLLDLQKAKLNIDDFGRLMGIGTGISTNGVTGQVRPTYNAVMSNLGYTRVGTFAAGGTVLNSRQTLLWDVADGGDGQEYGWSGSFLPSGKVVPPNSTPLTTGGISVGAWMSRFDPLISIQVRELVRRICAESGYNLVGGSFEAGGVLVNLNDVMLYETNGKVYSGPVGVVNPDTNPLTSGYTEVPDRVVISASSVVKLLSFGGNGIQYGAKAIVASYHQSTLADSFDTLRGGGVYIWSDVPKSRHDGGVVIDPDREFPTTWVSGLETDVYNWFFGPSNVGNGCWVLEKSTDITVGQYGAKGDFDGTNGTDDSNAFNAASKAKSRYSVENFNNNSTVKRSITVESSTRKYLIGQPCYVRKGQELRGVGLGGAVLYIKTPPVRAYAGDTFRLGVGLISNPFPTHSIKSAVIGTSYITLNGDIRDGGQYLWLSKGHFIKAGGVWHTVRSVDVTSGDTIIELMTPLAAGITPGQLIEESELNDSGGLPPSISNLCTEGGHVGSAVINGAYAAGMTTNTLFITTAPLGIYGLGGDINCHTTTFDNGGVGLVISGSRNSVVGCHFFWNDIGVYASGEYGGCFDWVFSSCTFAFNKFQDIALDLGAFGSVRKLNLTGCNFLENAQLATKTGMLHLISGEADVQMNGCAFSNMKAHAITQSAGRLKLRARGCTFDGLKSNVDYIQSTTASAVSVINGEIDIKGSSFENLPGDLVKLSSNSPDTIINVCDNDVINCGDGSVPFVNFNNNPIFKKVCIKDNNRLSGANPLIGGSITSDVAHLVTMENNDFTVYWDAGARKAASIMAVIGSGRDISISANTSPSASNQYSRSEIVKLISGTVNDGGIVDKLAVGASGLSLGGTSPDEIDYTIGFDTSGGKTRPSTGNKIAPVVITVPFAYSNISIN